MMTPAVIIVAAYAAIKGFGYLLSYLNLKSMRSAGDTPTPEFAGKVDEPTLARAREYAVANTRFSIAESLFDNAVLFVFLFWLIGPFDSWTAGLGLPFVLRGAVFYLLIFYADLVLSAAFGWYRAFGIEKRYGFNTSSIGLWAADLVKSALVATVIILLLVCAGLSIMRLSPARWWFWFWCFFLFFTVFMMYISPYVIEPLFNKFTPLDDPALEEGIRAAARSAGIEAGRVMKSDASRRTLHTNAYFTGIGRVKRIVLFDTLLERLDAQEIISVLAHEIGHWKKRHLVKMMAGMQTLSLVALYAAYRLLEGEFLNSLFGIHPGSLFTKLFVLAFIASIAAFPIGPLAAYFSRRNEREADAFAAALMGDGQGLASALVKLSRDNLANLHPHPLYAAFHYSHPPVSERIRLLRGFKGGK